MYSNRMDITALCCMAVALMVACRGLSRQIDGAGVE
jgi:hypothetical protein